MKRKYHAEATINFDKGETSAYFEGTRKETARWVRGLMAWHKRAGSFVFTIARAGQTAESVGGGDVE